MDTLEHPLVFLKNGSVVRVSLENFESMKGKVEKILFLGDILISFGDFLYTSKPLSPSGYVEEWWVKDLKIALTKFDCDSGKAAEAATLPEERLNAFLADPFINKPTVKEATLLSLHLGVPLHPQATFFWSTLSSVQDVALLQKWLSGSEVVVEEGVVRKIVGTLDPDVFAALRRIFAPHRLLEGKMATGTVPLKRRRLP